MDTRRPEYLRGTGGWVLGGMLVFGVGLWRYQRMRRLLLRSGTSPNHLVQRLIDKTNQAVEFRQPFKVIESESIDSPLVTGLFSPLLVLPGRFFLKLEQNEQWALIAHELVHLKRRDHIVMWIEHLVFALHFFNPLVWMAIRRLRIERERACDDRVLELIGQYSDQYGRALVKVVQHREQSRCKLLPAVSLVEGGRETAKRMRRILTPSRQVVTRVPMTALLVLLLGGCIFFLNSDDQSPENQNRLSDYFSLSSLTHRQSAHRPNPQSGEMESHCIGDVWLISELMVLSCDDLLINWDRETIVATGNVELTVDTCQAISSQVNYDHSSHTFVLDPNSTVYYLKVKDKDLMKIRSGEKIRLVYQPGKEVTYSIENRSF